MKNKRQTIEDLLIMGGITTHDIMPYTLTKRIMRISRLAKRFNKLAEYYCNGDIHEEAYTRNTDKLVKDINIEVGCLGGSVVYQYDPRGACVKLSVAGRDFTNLLYNL